MCGPERPHAYPVQGLTQLGDTLIGCTTDEMWLSDNERHQRDNVSRELQVIHSGLYAFVY